MKKISYLDMVRTLLPEEEFEAFAQSYTQPLKKSVKILKSDQHFFSLTKGQLEKDGRTLVPPNFSWKGKLYDDVLFVEKEDRQSLGSHWMHQAGMFYVQEMAAGLPAQVLGVKMGEIVLDMCAAPGGKSIQLADFLLSPSSFEDSLYQGKNTGLLIANELDPGRRKALKANLERCGIWNAVITGYDGRKLGALLCGQCDKVLLDAPCSGEGMQYKSDFKIYGRNEKVVRKQARLQKELLISGLQCLKVGGELVYSTCTTNVIENEGVVAEVLEELGGSVELVNIEIEEKSGDSVARFWPHVHHTGGFFVAKFRRIAEDGFGSTAVLRGRFARLQKTMALGQSGEGSKYEICSQSGLVERYLEEGFGLAASDFSDYIFVKSPFTIFAVSKSFVDLGCSLRFEQVGLPILKVLNDGSFVPLEGLAKLFGGMAKKNVLDIDDEQAKLLMQKVDLKDERLKGFEGQYVVLRWKGKGIKVKRIRG